MSGSIRVELTSRKGRQVTLYHIKPGESCVLTTSALLNSEHYYARGLTETDVEALAINPDAFHQFIHLSPHFAKYVPNGFAKRMNMIVSLVDRMATRDTQSTIIHSLLDQHKTGIVQITQKELAMEIGTAREVISRNLPNLNVKTYSFAREPISSCMIFRH